MGAGPPDGRLVPDPHPDRLQRGVRADATDARAATRGRSAAGDVAPSRCRARRDAAAIPRLALRDGGGLPRDERGLRPLLRREPGRGVGGRGGHGAPAAGPVRVRRADPSRGGAPPVLQRAEVPRDGAALECRHRRHARHGRGLPGELHQGGVLDSDTAVAVISGIPSATDEQNILPPDKMVETREIVNRLAASRRIVSHGPISPNNGRRDLEDMERQAKELKVEAWEGYTGQPMGLTGGAWAVYPS